MQLPLKLTFDQLTTRWKSILDPLLQVTLTQGQQLDDVKLIMGTTTINHNLGRKLQGWFTVSKNAAADIYDSQMTNPTPDKTLQLVSSAPVTISLWVY